MKFNLLAATAIFMADISSANSGDTPKINGITASPVVAALPTHIKDIPPYNLACVHLYNSMMVCERNCQNMPCHHRCSANLCYDPNTLNGTCTYCAGIPYPPYDADPTVPSYPTVNPTMTSIFWPPHTMNVTTTTIATSNASSATTTTSLATSISSVRTTSTTCATLTGVSAKKIRKVWKA